MTTATAPFAPSLYETAGTRVESWVGKIARAWSRHRTYRRALTEMRALPTDTLLDLDIYRGDLKRLLRDARPA